MAQAKTDDSRAKAEKSAARGPASVKGAAPSAWDFEVFFDGDCPLCAREVRMLMRLDEPARRIRFTDISAPDFDASAVGLSYDALMESIHGRLPSGEVVQGVEVFRQLYAAVGFRRLVALTRLPGVSWLLSAGYALFAKNRLRLTGRCGPDGCALPRRAPQGG